MPVFTVARALVVPPWPAAAGCATALVLPPLAAAALLAAASLVWTAGVTESCPSFGWALLQWLVNAARRAAAFVCFAQCELLIM
jgi:hypothetical protein